MSEKKGERGENTRQKSSMSMYTRKNKMLQLKTPFKKKKKECYFSFFRWKREEDRELPEQRAEQYISTFIVSFCNEKKTSDCIFVLVLFFFSNTRLFFRSHCTAQFEVKIFVPSFAHVDFVFFRFVNSIGYVSSSGTKGWE